MKTLDIRCGWAPSFINYLLFSWSSKAFFTAKNSRRIFRQISAVINWPRQNGSISSLENFAAQITTFSERTEDGTATRGFSIPQFCQVSLLTKPSKEKYVSSNNQIFLTSIAPISSSCSIAFPNISRAIMAAALSICESESSTETGVSCDAWCGALIYVIFRHELHYLEWKPLNVPISLDERLQHLYV